MSLLQTYLVTGANRGIGRGLVTSLLLRPCTIVVAAVRDPTSETSRSLVSLPKASESRLVLVKIESSSASDPLNAVAELTAKHKIPHLDVVIANAGINTTMAPVLQTTPEEMRNIFEVNTISPLMLFQATWPLLQKSKKPTFVVMSSEMATIGDMIPLPGLAYGVSKAALNYVVKKVHIEHENVTAIALNPGWVKTDMGYQSAKLWGTARQPPTTIEDSIHGCLKQIDDAERDGCSAIVGYDGSRLAW